MCSSDLPSYVNSARQADREQLLTELRKSYVERTKGDKVIADYDEALKYDARDAYSWNNRAIAKRELGDKDGAIADFKKALEINPTLASAKKALSDLGAAP